MARLTTLPLVAHLAWRGARWALGDRSPIGATLKLTDRCNLACSHCPWAHTGTPDRPTEQWLAIIARVAARGARFVVFEGGEPLLRDDLGDLLAAARQHGMRTTIATNGLLPLSALAPDRFLISVDGCRETHDHLRGKNAFDRMLANLPTTTTPRVGLVSIWRGNADEIEAIAEQLAPHLDGFWFSFVYDYAGQSNSALTPLEQRVVADRLLALGKKYRVFNTSSFLRQVGRERRCRPWLLTTITADGQEASGCVIGAREPVECDRCELACHRELSDLLEPRFVIDQLRTHLAKPWL